MQKNSARIKQDRTLSLDIANVLSPISNFSTTMPLSDAKMLTLRKYTPNTAINAQETLRTVLEDHIFNNQMHYASQNNSPTSRSKPPRKSLIPTHSNTSAMNNSRPSSRSKRGEYSLSISQCKENENDYSLNNAIQKAYNLQVEKEKQLKESKTEAEQELRQLKDNIKAVEKNIVIQKNCLNDQQLGLLTLMKEFGDSLSNTPAGNTPGSISYSRHSFGDQTTVSEEEKIQLFSASTDDNDNELEKSELMKMLVDINTNLSQDLKVFQDMLESRNYMGFANLDTSSFQSIINANEENFRCLINEKNLLIRKMYEIEDKLHQANETKNMITEDINSHVVSITEGVVLQEEMEQMLESLRSRNPVFYNKIIQEQELNDKLMEIGFEVKKREKALQEVMQARDKDENKLSRYLQESHQIYIEIENLKDLEVASKEKLLDSQLYLYSRFQQCFEEIPIFSESLEELNEYICVFRLYNKKENDFKEYEARILEYQSQILQEMQIVLQTRQDIDNLENTLLKLHLGGASSNGNSKPGTPNKTSSYIPICDKRIVTKSIQDEIINKKMRLAEKTAGLSFTKNILISNVAENTPLRGILTGHASLSFFEIMKKIGNNLEVSSFSKLVSLMLSLVNNSKVQAETYQKLAKAVGPKNDRLLELSNSIQDLKKNVAHYDHAIQQEMPKFKAIKEEEALYSSHKQLLEESYKSIIMTETKRDYQSYMQEHEKRLKKIRFQYGKQFVTKLSSDLMDDYLNSNMSSLSKFKLEIQEVHEMVLKMEEYRSKTTSKLENELKPALENVKQQMKEYRVKLDDLNCDLLDIIDNEERIAQNLNQNYGGGQSRVQSAREVGNGITYANNIYTSFQVYKGRVSDLFKNIIEGFRKVLEREILTPSKNMELKMAMEKIQQEITNLLDKHIKFLNMAEKELKEYHQMIADREAKLQYYQVQLQKSKNFYEISDQLLKNKEESTATATGTGTTNQTTQGKEVDPYKTRFKGRLKSSRSVSKLSINLKENVEPERTTCTMDLTTKRNSVTSTSTPKVNTPEPRKFWLQNSGNKTAGHTRSQTPNMTSFSSTNPQNIINFENERISIRVRPSNTSLEQNYAPPLTTGKTDRAPIRYFNLDEDQMKELLREFEYGLPVQKKLNTNTSGLKPPSWNQTTTIKVEKNGEVKGFGKRLLRVNLSAKSIEVIKLTGPQMRRTLEYIYLWKDLKKVFVPPSALKQARELLSEGASSSGEMLQFSLDVLEKGRIDFLGSNPWHLAIIWNVVNQILTQGRVAV